MPGSVCSIILRRFAKKNFIDTEAKRVCDFEGERKRRVEASILYRVDRVAGDADTVCQICLTPFVFSPKHTDTIFQ